MSATGAPNLRQQLIAECRSAFLAMLDAFALTRGIRLADSRAAMTHAAAECFDELARLRGKRGFEQAHGLTASRISLISEHDLSLTIELTGLAKRLREHAGPNLARLSQRFVVLLEQTDAVAEQLPVGPEAVCRALRGLVENAGLDPDQRIDLLKNWEASLTRELGSFYGKLDDKLDKAGIRARPGYVPWTATGPATDPPSGAPPASRPLPAPTPATAPPSIVPTLPEDRPQPQRPQPGRLPQEAPGTPAPAAAPAGWPTLHGDESASTERPAPAETALPALSDEPDSLQARLRDRLVQRRAIAAAGAPGLDPRLGAAIIEQVRTWLTSLQQTGDIAVPAIASSPLGHLLDARTASALEVLEQLLDHLADRPEWPQPIRKLLPRLKIPLLRLVLDDARLAVDPDLPLLAFLDNLAAAACTLPSDCAALAGYRQIEGIMLGLCLRSGLQTGHLKEAATTLHGLAEMRRNAAFTSSQPAFDLAARAEQRESARILAVRALQAMIDEKTPAAIQRFLTTHWLQVLVRTLYRLGDKHPDWRNQLEIAHQFLLTGSTDASGRMPPSVAAQLAALLNRIGIRLTSIGLGAEAQKAALADSIALHASLLAGHAPDPLPYDGAVTSPMTLSKAREIPRLRMLHHVGYTVGRAQAPDWMNIGTWIEISLPDKSIHCGCITWIGPAARVALIGDPDSGALLAATAHCLASLEHAGRVRTGNDRSATERATQAILRQLNA